MKIAKNTSRIPTAFLRKVFTRVHSQAAKIEGRCKHWKSLRVVIRQRTQDHESGHVQWTHDNKFDWFSPMILTLGSDVTTRRIARIFYHELMHVYEYDHRHGCDPSSADLDAICSVLPEMPPEPAPRKTAYRDLVAERYQRMLMRRVSWKAKLKRAENGLAKVEKEISAYERRHGDRLGMKR